MAETTKTDVVRADVVRTDAIIVGAGVAGLYLLHRLRNMNFSAVALEAADDVGGTWYWNRYPGARCDVPSLDYSYSWDAELQQEWEWSEKYATQPEILRYLQHVAERHDLRRDIEFETRVERSVWNDETQRWTITTSTGTTYEAQWFIMATGCLSKPKMLDIDGADQFAGPTYFTSSWPHDGVDFTGQRVAVIGTGSSGIQSIPIIADQAAELTVYQRTPNFSLPAYNGPISQERLDDVKPRYDEYREEARWSGAGVPLEVVEESMAMLSDEERARRLESAWDFGHIIGFGSRVANDSIIRQEANDIVADFVRDKIRSVVDDPEVAELLCPNDHPIQTKRLCLDTNYYQTFNRDHVTLHDLRSDPIATITEHGIETAQGSREFDAIVFATGFDAMTGAIVAVDIEGRDGLTLKDKWADGPVTYLGLTSVGFPNLFMVTGPGSPSVLSNMAVSIEQHVEWITDCIDAMRSDGVSTIEATPVAEAGWQQHVLDCADMTLFPKAKSWYMGANVPGKPRVFLPYVGGVGPYREACNDVVEQGWLGFERRGEAATSCNDGVVRRLMPDVAGMLSVMAEMELPAIESLPVVDARAMMAAGADVRPPGPDVGEIVDGTYPGADGNDLAYRLYRPSTPGPHALIVYYHGGGWVLGSAESDDPLCRDLCDRTGAAIISMDYRHAPEAPFPAAVDDGYAALCWAVDNADSLGVDADRVVVAGWSAGANVAAVACHMARDNEGPNVLGQLLVTPVTDCDFTRPSYTENADGYVLTRGLMDWFWDHYCPADQRTDPRASPLRAEDLSGLPPAAIVTCEFDPLRDEGAAYVEALVAAGTPATHLPQRGHIHTSIGTVDVLITPMSIREQVGEALMGFLAAAPAGVSA